MAVCYSRRFGNLVAISLIAGLAAGRAGGSKAAPYSFLDGDRRLQSRTCLRFRRSPLSAVLAELGRQSGAAVTAAPEVADEPVIVYANNQPAKEVMRHIALLLDYQWRKKDKQPEGQYELYQDLGSRQSEKSLRGADKTQAIQWLLAAFRQRERMMAKSGEELTREASALEQEPQAQQGAAEGVDAEGRGPGRAAPVQLQERARLLRQMANPLNRALFEVATCLRPADWEALLSGRSVTASAHEEAGMIAMPVGVADDLRGAQLFQFAPGSPLRGDPRAEAAVQIEQQAWKRAQTIRVTAWIEMAQGELGPPEARSASSGLARPAAALSVVPQAVMPEGDSAAAPDAPGLSISSDETPAMGGSPEPAEPCLASEETDPLLNELRPVPLTRPPAAGLTASPSMTSLNNVLPAIAESCRLNLVADAYAGQNPVLPAPDVDRDVRPADLLRRYVFPCSCWQRQGDFVHVRRLGWQWYRPADIPDRIAEEWSSRLKRQRRLALDGAARLVLTLRDEQLLNFAETMEGCGVTLIGGAFSGRGWQDELFVCRDALRAYGLLPEIQRQQLNSGRLVPFSEVAPVTQELIMRALESKRHIPADPVERLRRLCGPPPLPGWMPAAISLAESGGEGSHGGPPQPLCVSLALRGIDPNEGVVFECRLPVVNDAGVHQARPLSATPALGRGPYVGAQ